MYNITFGWTMFVLRDHNCVEDLAHSWPAANLIICTNKI